MKNITVLIVLALCFFSFNPAAIAGQTDQLINKLVDKNIITQQEAQELLTQQAPDKQSLVCSMPEIVKTLKFKGDLRFRYQGEEKDTTSASSTTNAKRERARIRLRLGLEANPAEDWTVKAGLASGSNDPRSTNQTFQDNFASKPIQLDYAYGVYASDDKIKVLAGKIENKNTLWLPSNLLWDSDINPEGLEIQLGCNDNNIWLNSGYFILDEISAGADPSMFFVQPGFSFNSDDIKLKGSFNYYVTNSVKGLDYSNIVFGSSSNTTTGTPASFKYDYDCWGISAEIGKNNWVKDFIDYGALFFDSINNPDPSSENSGYLIGLKLGDAKLNKAGNWQAKMNYRKLGKDAWLDFLPNSAFLGGQTDAQGYEYVLKYVFIENLSMSISYYNTETIKSTVEEKEDYLLVDFCLKF